MINKNYHQITLDRALETLAEREADRITLHDNFSEPVCLSKPLNDPDTGDAITVAELSIEDSGYGPALWSLALFLVALHTRGFTITVTDPDDELA